MDTKSKTTRPLLEETNSAGKTTKVFVSYSRSDELFVMRFVDALRGQNDLHVFRDTDDVLPSEEWWERLEGLIVAADTIVFCISQRSLESEVCAREVELAATLKKRIIPVVLEPPKIHVPEGLAKLNWIHFDSPDDFEQSLAILLTTLRTDIAWIREHTRIGESARRWALTKRREQLMRGAELHDAEQWLMYRSPNAPELTEDMFSYIHASRAEEISANWRRRRGNMLLASLAALTLFVSIGYAFQAELKREWTRYVYFSRHLLSKTDVAQLQTLNSFRECAEDLYCPEMVVLPSGEFLMGSPTNETNRKSEEGPTHKVYVRRFAIGRFEITHDQWQACADSTNQAAVLDRRIRNPQEIFVGCALASDSGYGKGRRPVININWYDAQGYVRWLNEMTTGNAQDGPYRLPSESEWEYAARGQTTTAYSWGNEIDEICNYANVANKETKEKFSRSIMWNVVDCPKNFLATAPVGSFKPNPFQLFDVHGNAWEWVQDCWSASYEGAPSDGTPRNSGDCALGVMRGGSWGDPSDVLRSASRFRYERTSNVDGIGFRVARTLERK